MIGTIRKHSRWLWFIIIGAMIVGLIAVFQPGARFSGTSNRSGNFGSIDGESISRDELFEAQREVSLRYFLTYGTWPDRDTKRTSFDLQRETYQWLFLARKLREYDIQVDSTSVARAADDILRGVGRGNPVPLDAFVQQALMPRASVEDFERFLRHDLGLQQLMSVVALGGGLATVDEAQYLYERDHQEFSTEAVFFSASNYLAAVPVASPAAVTQFYTNEMSAYHVPERVQVSYVAFDITNSLAHAEAQLTNLTALVEQKFRQLGTNYVRFGKTPDEVRARVRSELIREQALIDEQKKADEFANELFAMDPVQAGNLSALARTNGLTVGVTRPFDEENGPAEFDGGPDFAKQAFELTADKPFPDQTIVGENAVYLIALERRIPDEILPLDQIRDRVTADYRLRQAVLLARSAGEDFVRAAAGGLAQGRRFAGICADSRVTPVVLPPFSLSTRDLPGVMDEATLGQFRQIAFTTPPGRVSDFNPTHDGGMLVYVQSQLPLDEAQMKAEMPAFINTLRRTRAQEAFNQWFGKEGAVSLRDTPLMAQRKASGATGGEAQP